MNTTRHFHSLTTHYCLTKMKTQMSQNLKKSKSSQHQHCSQSLITLLGTPSSQNTAGQKGRGFLWTPFLPKHRLSKRNTAIRNPLREVPSIRRENLELIPHPDKPCHKLSFLPSTLQRAPSSFWKANYLPQRGLSPLSLLRWNSSQNSKPPQGVTHFPLGLFHVNMSSSA